MMQFELANRVKNIKPSATLTLAAKAKELKSQGKNIIDLTLGEPDFPTPAHIKEAAIKAIHDNFTKYTAVDGIPSLKKAIAAKLKNENTLQYELDQIIVSVGAKHAIYNLFQAILNEGDEVIIPAPYWVSYPDMVMLADGKPIIIKTGIAQNYKITPAQLEQTITSATKAIILNSPSNPTGVVYSPEDLAALSKILLKHPNILIITDDIYEHILWSKNKFKNILNVCPELYDRTVIINGVSKTYAMTGWRIGYAAGPKNIIATMKKIQSQSTSNPTSISQIAAQAALEGDQECVKEMANAFKHRHDFVVAELQEVKEIAVIPVDGAFYAFPNIEKAMQKTHCKTDVEFAELLLNKAEIAVVPGSAFGAPGYIRISYATDLNSLAEALKRLQTLIAIS